jgi:hypothetical protein
MVVDAGILNSRTKVRLLGKVSNTTNVVVGLTESGDAMLMASLQGYSDRWQQETQMKVNGNSASGAIVFTAKAQGTPANINLIPGVPCVLAVNIFRVVCALRGISTYPLP